MPIVSVLLPVYNCEKYILESVCSIINQSFNDFELIIIDDASTDNTFNILKQAKDPRIKLIQKEVNTGYTDSLNIGLQLSTGKYIARMDGDDISLPDRFKTQVSFLDQHSEVAVCGTWYQFEGTDEKMRFPTGSEELKLALLEHSPLAHPSVMIRKSVLKDNNLVYDRNMEPAEDYDLWVRILQYGKIANIPEIHLKYRLHQSQVSSVREQLQKQNAVRAREKLLGYLYNVPPPVSITEKMDLVDDIKINRKLLLQFLLEIERVRELNAAKVFFNQPGFSRFLDNKKRLAIHSYFRHPYSYGWKNLFFFLFNKNIFFRNFNNHDKIKVIIKNIKNWK